MSLSVLIVDEEPFAIATVERLVKETAFLRLKQSFTDPRQALLTENLRDVDLIFLDIQMPQLNGYNFLDMLRGRSRVILMTSYEEYALKGYEYDEVVDFLLKPINPERFFKAAYRAYQLVEETRQTGLTGLPPAREGQPGASFFVKVTQGGGIVQRQIHLKDIVYVEVINKSLKVGLSDKSELKLVGDIPLSDFLADKLPAALFMQVHRSYVVAKRFIQSLQGNQLYLTDEKVIPVGTTFRDVVDAFVDPNQTGKSKL